MQEGVLVNGVGTVALTIATHIRRHRMEASFGQRWKLVAPGIPALREAVTEDDKWAMWLPWSYVLKMVEFYMNGDTPTVLTWNIRAHIEACFAFMATLDGVWSLRKTVSQKDVTSLRKTSRLSLRKTSRLDS